MIDRIGHRVLPATIALVACLLGAGCSSSTKSATTTSPAAPASTTAASSTSAASSTTAGSSTTAAAVSITIKNFAFTVSGAAAAGSMVTVTNNDTEAHSVTADAGNAFNVTIQPGKTASFAAPKKAGTVKFHCNFHSNMHGTLTVTA